MVIFKKRSQVSRNIPALVTDNKEQIMCLTLVGNIIAKALYRRKYSTAV